MLGRKNTPSAIKKYEDALGYLLSLTSRGIKPGLSRIRRAFRALGHPERRFPSIVIGGTNGKGSVASLVSAAAVEQGYKVGLFTSPHLHRLTERIRINGREVGRRQLIESLGRVIAVTEEARGPKLTFFETLTVMAADIFQREGVDLAVLEVGLGGRLDATKVFPAQVVVITQIALDHQGFLGDTLQSIAVEKFSLARRGSAFIVGDLADELLPLLEDRVRTTRCTLQRARVDFSWKIRGLSLEYNGPAGRLSKLPLPLRGIHQAHNMALGITATTALGHRGIVISEPALRRALSTLKWPGRLEVIRHGRVVLDVAHNGAGAEALCRELPRLGSGRHPIVAVFGCMKDKDIESIARPLARVAHKIVLVAPKMPRALDPEEFPRWLGGIPESGVVQGVVRALELAGENGLVVVTGSTFVVADARAYLLDVKKLDPSIPM